MKLFSKVIIFYSICFSSLSNSVQIPSSFQLCNREDPGINKCLKKSLRHLFPLSVDGFREVKVPSLDPYFDKEAYIEFNRNQIALKFGVYNITVLGLSQVKIHDVRSNLQDDSLYLEVDASAKRIITKGVFSGTGRLNAFVVKNEGFFNNTMDDLTWTWKIKGLPVMKNGTKYMKTTEFDMRPEVGNMKMYMSDILPDNPGLSRFFREFSEANWKILYLELLPFAASNWERTGKRICNKIFGKIPYDELFPPERDD